MRTVEVARERRIDASLERLWPLVSAVERLPEWFAFADEAELVEGAGLGRRQRIRGRWGSHPYEIDQRVTEWEPPRSLGWNHERERFGERTPPRFARETRFRVVLASVEGGTSVRLESNQEPMSRVRGLVLRAAGSRDVARRFERSLERLEAAVRA